MKTHTDTSRPLVTLVVLNEWRAWDRLRIAINRRIDDPTEENRAAVREAAAAYVETSGEVYRW